MLHINNAFRPTEPRWQQISVTTIHRAVPGPGELGPIPTTGIAIWVPTFPCFIRGFSCNSDSGDPLVGAGGATQISLGVSSAVNVLIISTALATFGTSMLGWGGSGPRVNDGLNGVADAGLMLVQAGGVPGQAAMLRSIVAASNLGTVTGTLRFRFEMRAFAGPW